MQTGKYGEIVIMCTCAKKSASKFLLWLGDWILTCKVLCFHSLRMARLETLRIEQGKNLYHIVREEQELEKEASSALHTIFSQRETRTACEHMPNHGVTNGFRARQRLKMLSAVQPGRVAHLNRLFEQERLDATERIMRLAAENEMVLLQEMARLAAADEPQFWDDE